MNRAGIRSPKWVGVSVKSKSLMGIRRHSAVLAHNLNANESALESHTGAVPVNVGIVGSEPFFCSCFCSFRALQIDFGSQFGGFREDGNAVRQNFREATNH